MSVVLLTVAAGKVNSDLTGFPLFIDLSLLGASFWAGVHSTGKDIRVKNSADAYVPIDLITINSVAHTGTLFARVDLLAASDNDFTVEYGDHTLSLVPDSDPLGQYAVWADYKVFMHAHGGVENRVTGTNGTISGTINNGTGPAGWTTFNGTGRITYTPITASQTWTCGARVVPNSLDSNHGILSYSRNTADSSHRATTPLRGATDSFGLWNDTDSWMNDPATATAGTQYTVHTAHNGTSGRKLLVNGVQKNSAGSCTAKPPLNTDNALFVGASDSASSEPLVGALLFAYVRNAYMSNDWLKAEHDSISAPGTFITFADPPPTDALATQLAVLVADASDSDIRATQLAVLALSLEGVDVHATQLAVLTLSMESMNIRATQLAVLALVHETPCLQTLCQCWRIERQDGTVMRFTTHDEAVSFQGAVYQPCDSLRATAASGGILSSSAGDIAMQGLIADESISARDILGGLYNGATVEVWETQWTDTEPGFIPRRLMRGVMGRISQSDAVFKADALTAGARLMQRPLLHPHTPSCRYDLGDGRCPVALGPITVTGSITGLPALNALQRSKYRMFSDSSRAEADGYFADGRITWTSGLNTGLSAEVRTNVAGVFTLWAPMPYEITAGDTYSMVPGCNKTRDDHTVKFGLNMTDFGGFPDLPGFDAITRTPDAKS